MYYIVAIYPKDMIGHAREKVRTILKDSQNLEV